MIADSIRFKLQEYWEHIDELTTIGTLLDPRSKTKTFIDINQRDKAITLLHNKVELFKNDTNRCRDFLILASMASCYLSIQGSSVPSEQIFSMATNTITKIRYNLKPDTERSAICLKS
ncbi:6009_t:CDS:2 [Scutellospora calospora]|uniref:6009_t:CDS:1 n=1 Tax=Scutellospora calospora TaxID=85575 RepID=A0ACA9N8Z2_9GLOM|nr:6009_t:CDS:2 [Scutellospora calospora]